MAKDTLTGTAEYRALVAAARHGLGEGTSQVTLGPTLRDAVLAGARFDRLSGLLALAVLDGAVTATDDDLKLLWEQWHDELLLSVRLEALAVRTADVLDAGGVNWRLTKGPALAHLDYPHPAARTFGDIDLLVHPADWSAAVGLLSASGYRREAPTLPGDYDSRYGKGTTLTTAEGLEVDLHRRFAIGRFGVTARMETVFASAASVQLGGRSMPVLDAPGRLLHACFHASLGGFRGLRAFRDVAQLILVTSADWEATFSVARSWKAEAVVASAIRESWDRLELDVEHPAHARATSTTISRGDRRVLQMFAREAPFRSQALSSLRRLPPSEVPRYLWSLGRRKRRQP